MEKSEIKRPRDNSAREKISNNSGGTSLVTADKTFGMSIGWGWGNKVSGGRCDEKQILGFSPSGNELITIS